MSSRLTTSTTNRPLMHHFPQAVLRSSLLDKKNSLSIKKKSSLPTGCTALFIEKKSSLSDKKRSSLPTGRAALSLMR